MKLNPIIVPIVTLVTTGIALTLSVIAVVGTGKKDVLSQYSTVQFNTSTLLRNAVKVETSSPKNRRALPTPFPSPHRVEVRDMSHLDSRGNPLDDGINGASSFVGSVVEPLGSAINSGILPIATAIGTGIIPLPTNFALNNLEGAFSQLLGQVPNLIENGVDNGINLMISEIMKILGIKQWYGLYFGEFCSANYVPNSNDPDASLSDIDCKPIRKTSKNSTSHETFKVGPVPLNFSALNIPKKITGSDGQLTSSFRTVFAIQVFGMVSSGLVILTTPLLFFGQFNASWVQLAAGLAGLVATLCFSTVSIIQSTVAITLGGMANQLGDGLGISAQKGGPQLALLWVSSGLMLIATSLLIVQWFDKMYVRKSLLSTDYKPVDPGWKMEH